MVMDALRNTIKQASGFSTNTIGKAAVLFGVLLLVITTAQAAALSVRPSMVWCALGSTCIYPNVEDYPTPEAAAKISFLRQAELQNADNLRHGLTTNFSYENMVCPIELIKTWPTFGESWCVATLYDIKTGVYGSRMGMTIHGDIEVPKELSKYFDILSGS